MEFLWYMGKVTGFCFLFLFSGVFFGTVIVEMLILDQDCFIFSVRREKRISAILTVCSKGNGLFQFKQVKHMDCPASVFRFKAVPGYNKSKLYTSGLGLSDFIMRSRDNSRRLGDPPRPHETHVMPNTGSRSDSKISIQHSKALQQ